MIDNIEIKYSVGPLMYSPALNSKFSNTIINGKLGTKYSAALCLEDTIAADSVNAAEEQIISTFHELYDEKNKHDVFIPKLFIRVREPEQISRVYREISIYGELFTGFILPKYTVTNAQDFNNEIRKINETAAHKVYMMPILESRDLIDVRTRNEILGGIREFLDEMKDLVLNIRVGGNDFSNEFAVRRHCDETIYDIAPISQLFGDILSVFSREYVVSGPVWEYFADDNDAWADGLRREIKMDILNGFVGKTVIHPKQIPIVNEMMKIPRKDFEDSATILAWKDSGLQVSKSAGGERMNEVRTNYNWAVKTATLAGIYGIR